ISGSQVRVLAEAPVVTSCRSFNGVQKWFGAFDDRATQAGPRVQGRLGGERAPGPARRTGHRGHGRRPRRGLPRSAILAPRDATATYQGSAREGVATRRPESPPATSARRTCPAAQGKLESCAPPRSCMRIAVVLLPILTVLSVLDAQQTIWLQRTL